MASEPAKAPLIRLREQGQAIWLDFIRRGLVSGGELKRLIEEDGLTGITSNPSIFEKAISDSSDYDRGLREAKAQGQSESREVYDNLAIEDVHSAGTLLLPVYEKSSGADGFVSLEPPPQLTRDTNGTVAEARRLWRAVQLPNLMIKVVASREGIPAIEQLISEGINVNITLMFSQQHYEAVVEAYLSGLERSREPSRVSSVASFFVSRIDTVVDGILDANGSPDALALRGAIAIANAKRTYRRFREIFQGARFEALRRRGAKIQRVLWASTGTKNPTYRDVRYIEELIGPDTVNTIPPKTLNAFRQHGRVRGATICEGVEAAEEQLRLLSSLGIDLNSIAQRLQIDGIALFAKAYDQVLAAIENKAKTLNATAGNRSL